MKRTITLLLAAAMLATFLPTAVFAGSGDWKISGSGNYDFDLKEDRVAELGVSFTGEKRPALEYMLQKNGKTYAKWKTLPAPKSGDYVGVKWETAVLGKGSYRFIVREKKAHGVKKQSKFTIGSVYGVWKSGIRYGFMSTTSKTVAVLGGKTTEGDDLSGDIRLLDEVVLADGKTHKVTRITANALCQIQKGRVKSVIIPPTIKKIPDTAFGDNPKFTVIGKKGSVAEKFAKKHKLRFKASNYTTTNREWLGTLNEDIPKAKSVKAVAGKKSIKVSWKKRKEADLKLFTKVEVQVCPDEEFSQENTVRKQVKKSEESVTVKKLQSNRTYYVRVRNIKGSGKTKQGSKWSDVRKVKVK